MEQVESQFINQAEPAASTEKKNEEKHYYVHVNGVLQEVSEAVYRVVYQENRKENYQAERDKAFNVVVTDIEANEEYIMKQGAKYLSNIYPSPEAAILSDDIYEQLYLSIEKLSEKERALIDALYFQNLSTTQYAKRLGVFHVAIIHRHQRILTAFQSIPWRSS